MLESGKNNRKILIIAGICLVAFGYNIRCDLMAFSCREGRAGEKTIGLTVVFSQDNQKEYKIHTDAENLGDALKEEKLVDGTQGEYGLYIETVDGVTADASNQEWWCITKGGETLNTSADLTPIADGEHYELTLSKW